MKLGWKFTIGACRIKSPCVPYDYFICGVILATPLPYLNLRIGTMFFEIGWQMVHATEATDDR